MRRFYWLPALIPFLLVRHFSAFPWYPLTDEACSYLINGASFPWHHASSGLMWLVHPPLWGWTIGLLDVFLPLLAAGLASVQLMALLTFVALERYGRLLGLSRPAVLVALLYFSLHRLSIFWCSSVTRLPIFWFTITVVLLCFEHYLQQRTARWLLASAGAVFLAFFTSDQTMLILPALAWCYLARGDFRDFRRMALFGLACVIAYMLWPSVRLAMALTHEHYPAGTHAIIEPIGREPLKTALQPNLLPNTQGRAPLDGGAHFVSLKNYQFSRYLVIPFDLVSLPFGVSQVIVFTLLIASFFHRERWRVTLTLAGVFGILYGPISIHMKLHYGAGFLIPFSLLLGHGLDRFPARARQVGAGMAALAALALSIAWLAFPESPTGPWYPFEARRGRHFLYRREPIVRGGSVARQLQALPASTGVMAHIELAPELALLTGKRVIPLPFDPQVLDQQLAAYDIACVVMSDDVLEPQHKDEFTYRWSGQEVMRSILAQPERFPQVWEGQESYPGFLPPRKYYLFEVRRSN